jgi:hypothetical protein
MILIDGSLFFISVYLTPGKGMITGKGAQVRLTADKE